MGSLAPMSPLPLVWQCAPVRMNLYNGDCLEVLESLVKNNIKVDAVITDPPYEMSNERGGTKSPLGSRANFVRESIDFVTKGFDYNKVFKLLVTVCKVPNILMFCSNDQLVRTLTYFEGIPDVTTTVLTWVKPNPPPLCKNRYLSDLEFIVYVRGKGAPFNNDVPIAYKHKAKTYTPVRGKTKRHPTQKPEALIAELVSLHTQEGMTVLDPFMGSGTTGTVCKNLGRNFIGIELDKAYYDIATERINGEVIRSI